MSYQNRGQKWFKAGAVMLIVFGSVHLLAVYKGLFVEPTNPLEKDAARALAALRMDMGPFHPTGRHTVMILNASYSALLLYAGVLNLLTMNAAIAAGRLRSLTRANLIFCVLLAAICLIGQFPPPLLFAGLCVAFFGISLLKQSRSPMGAP